MARIGVTRASKEGKLIKPENIKLIEKLQAKYQTIYENIELEDEEVRTLTQPIHDEIYRLIDEMWE